MTENMSDAGGDAVGSNAHDDVWKKPDESGLEMFTFGDPVPVLEKWQAFYFGEAAKWDRWYIPPYDTDALAKTLGASSHHSSPLYVKRNILASTFVPHPLLSYSEFNKLALDYLIFSNAYLEKVTARTGKVMALKSPLSKYMRVGTDGKTYYFLTDGHIQAHKYKAENILHLMSPDVNQEVYGCPEYLAALNSVWLDESATLFRRKYYQNGSHAGYIMYVNDAGATDEDIANIRQAMRESKGPGNFRNLFLYSPNGKKDGIQILPISEVSANDDFWKIKEATRIDIAAAHRVPPQLMGATPTNTAGFGDVEKAARVFVINELLPLQRVFMQINDWVGEEVVRFTDYPLLAQAGSQPIYR